MTPNLGTSVSDDKRTGYTVVNNSLSITHRLSNATVKVYTLPGNGHYDRRSLTTKDYNDCWFVGSTDLWIGIYFTITDIG